MDNFLKISDLTNLGQVARHCDPVKFGIAAHEALNNDLCAIFGPYATEVAILINRVLDTTTDPAATDQEKAAVNGGIYQNGELKVNNLGLKTTLAYYTLERYTIANEYNDTPNGNVVKENPFSVPKSFKEVQQFASKYANLAKAAAESSLKFICLNITDYPTLKGLDCSIAGCGAGEDCGGITDGYSMKSSNIGKYD